MIRVALVSHLSEISGAGIALLRIAKSLNPQRFHTRVILPGQGPLYELAREQNLEVVVIENPEEGMAQASLRRKFKLLKRRGSYILSLVRDFRRERIDVAYVNTTITIFAGIAARLAGKRVVWHVRELLENPSRGMRLKMRLIEVLSDAIFYASEAGMALFPAHRVRHRLVVRNIVDVERFLSPNIPPTLDEELGIRTGEIVITTNGVFPRKAPDVFLRAAALLSQRRPESLRFLLVGPALPDHLSFYEQMKKLANELGIADKVSFTGLRTDMPAILARSDVFVSPSRNEAQPNIINEALIVGLPVVATDVGDCRKMLRNGEFGEIVPPDDPQRLADALSAILDDLPAAREKAQYARRCLVEEFTSPDFWRPVEEILAAVAKGS
ncbi:MAG: glycosyltransferase [Candidatus Sumerlaeaceae bacterium]|nr:glycosyltransferase [Candidatus Sumerlaeaceae bacterium]